MIEKTLSIIKPDGISNNLVGTIIHIIEKSDLKIVAMKMLKLGRSEAMKFYKIHKNKSFYNSLVEFMISGPIVVMVLEGENAIFRYRNIMGATNYKNAEEGTIRRKFAADIEKNIVHGSDTKDNASDEINFFFNSKEIMN